MLAAIIDDGIRTVSGYFQGLWFVDEDLSVKPSPPNTTDKKFLPDTHADTCFRIISKYISRPKNVLTPNFWEVFLEK
jgi:hypothetical protein